jgi:hypothetical protein
MSDPRPSGPSRPSHWLAVLAGMLGMYCTDTVVSSMSGRRGAPPADAQTGSCCQTVSTRTELARQAVSAAPGQTAVGDPIDVSAYDSVLVQWYEPGPACEDPDVLFHQRLGPELPFSQVVRNNASTGLMPVPVLGAQLQLSLLNDGGDPCRLELVIVGVRSASRPG